MPAFALPQAISPRVAATLSRYAHYTLLDQVYQRARTYDIRPFSETSGKAIPEDLPKQLTLIFDGRDRGKPTQLHLGRLPIPPRFWSYDADRGILSYKFKSNGVDHVGSLTFVHAASGAIGTLSVGDQHVGVRAVLPPVSYSCDVALDTGARVTGVAPALTLQWDASDPSWSSATWIENALTFSWQVTGEVVVGQPTYNIAVSFADQQTNTSWTPDVSEFTSVLDGNLQFMTTVAPGRDPPSGDRSKLPAPASGIKSVLPYILGFDLSDGANAITGAVLTGQASRAGTVLGLHGTVVNPSIAGIYAVSRANNVAGAMAVYANRLYIDNTLVASASIAGSRLTWSRLTAAQQQRSGLPGSGALMFSTDGTQCHGTRGDVTGRRLRPEQVARQFPGTPIASHPAITAFNALTSSSGLNPTSLSLMTQFASVDGGWLDVVQQATMNDFNQILLYYMPSGMRQTYYNVAQPVLPSWLQVIAAQGDNPAGWYQSLATAFLTNILSHSDQAGASQLNAIRAQAWLKSQTAASPVFRTQSTAIYAQEFINQPRNAALPQYLQDQADPNNTSKYAQLIETDAVQWTKDLQTTILDPNALNTMEQLVAKLSATAINNNLYWAYTLFRDLTMTQELYKIQMISIGNNPDLDGSAFMRNCQSYAAVLSLLDPSNTFSQAYVEVIQTFQIGNLLPTVLDFNGTDPSDFVFDLQLVLDQIAKNYQNSADPCVQQSAAYAEQLAQDIQLSQWAEIAQSAAAGSAAGSSWEIIAPRIEDQVLTSLAAKFGQVVGPKMVKVFMVGLAGIAILGIVMGGLAWKSLSSAQQASLAANAAAIGLELIGALVKRGVAVGALWDVTESNWAMFRAAFGGDTLKAASKYMDSAFGKWITESSSEAASGDLPSVFILNEETGEFVEQVSERSTVSKIFGRNLDELLGQRLAAVLAVVNLVLSIYDAVVASDPFERIADSLMAAAAALDLIAIVSAWALSAGYSTVLWGSLEITTICSACAVLAILAALAGLAIMLYMIYKPQQTAVQQFGSQYAQPVGLLMPYGYDIDYFNGYVNGTEPSRLGIWFVVDAAAQTVLTIKADGTTLGAAKQSYGTDSVFGVSTDANGLSQILALVQNQSGVFQTLVLTRASDDSVSFQAPLAASDKNYHTQQWSIVMQGLPRMDGSFPESAPFSVTAEGTDKTLSWDGTHLTAGSGSNWTIQQVPMAPQGLSMNNIKLYTFSTGALYKPQLMPAGSLPQTWSVTPALPNFLTFDTTSGTIKEVNPPSGGLPVTPAATFQLSVTNDVGTPPPPASFTIEVDEYTAPKAVVYGRA
jgi:hypothetical protein